MPEVATVPPELSVFTLRRRRCVERFGGFGEGRHGQLDIFWPKDDSLDNLDDLPSPGILQQEIIEHLEAALLAFRFVSATLPQSTAVTP